MGYVESDFASDRNECANQLVGLATCLPYVQGQAKAPTPDCCSGLKQVVDKSRKCLCVLIKNRDNPELGFKINATLALKLPGACSAPVNASECIDLLHLAPNSTDAQVFKQFEAGTRSASAKDNSTSSSNSGSSTASKDNNGASDRGGRRWVVRDSLLGFLIWWCLVSLVIMDG